MPVQILVVERFHINFPPVANEMRITLVIKDTDPPYSEDQPWYSEPFDVHIPYEQYSPEREKAELEKVLKEYLKVRKPELLEAVGWPPS